MHILHVTPILPNSFLAGIYGKQALFDRFASGGAVYVYELARAQAKLGASVTVAYPSLVPFDAVRDGVRFIGIRGFMQKPFSRIDPFGVVPLRILLSSDVVHVHQPRSYLALGTGVFTAFFRKPLFVTDLGKTGKLSIPHSFVTKYLDISRFARQNHPNQKTSVVYAGIDTARFRPAKKMHHRPYLFYAGAIREHKGQHHLVEIFLHIYKKYPTLDLVLAGGIIQPWYLEKIKSLGKSLGSRLKIVGIASEEKLVSLYQQCELFVSCSSHELFGLAIGEAMSCGKPVVALGVGSVPELVRDNKEGFIVPGKLWRSGGKNDMFPIDSMAKAVCRLLDDRNLTEHFEENARRDDMDFLWCDKSSVREFIFDKICNRHYCVSSVEDGVHKDAEFQRTYCTPDSFLTGFCPQLQRGMDRYSYRSRIKRFEDRKKPPKWYGLRSMDNLRFEWEFMESF